MAFWLSALGFQLSADNQRADSRRRRAYHPHPMGIHDRHYIRDRSMHGGSLGSRGVAAVRMWSVNTWIIVICVAVFVIDGFFPMNHLVPSGQVTLLPGITAAPDNIVVGSSDQYRRRYPGLGELPVYHEESRQQIGTVRVYEMRPIESYLHFSTERGFLRIEFWRLIGFQFLHSHGTIWHVVFNMLALFFFGPLVERYLGSKRYLAFYLLCGICGALLYALLNLGGLAFGEDVRIPGLLFNDLSTPLIGASAGVFGVLMAGAYLAPEARVLLFFLIPVKLRTLAYGLVLLALWTLIVGGRNAGGEAGHLGGAIAGFYFIRRPHHLHGFFDFLGRADPTSHHYRHRKGARAARQRAGPSQREIDRILDKISREGIQSLSDQEKRVLRDASGR